MTRVILATVCALLAPGLAGAQSSTPWGDPDLRGMWTNTTTTPLQRPSEFAGRSVLTDEERADLDAQADENRDRPPPTRQHRRIQQFLGRIEGRGPYRRR